LRHHIAIFVDGEFWHGKDWNVRKTHLGRNREYWIEKIEENMARDMRNDNMLRKLGWKPIHFWCKDVISNPDSCICVIESIVDD
jgi:DNA mismatch endonuclease (patch repair protein)